MHSINKYDYFSGGVDVAEGIWGAVGVWGDVVVFFAEGVGRGKSAEHRVVLAGVEVIEIQAVHAIKLFARVLIAVGRRRKDIAEIATWKVRYISISDKAND